MLVFTGLGVDVSIATVLLVDDEPDIRRIGELALSRVGGLKVTAVANGLEALAVVEKLQPDVILLDVMMPGIDGPTTLERLLLMPSVAHIPVIFMTAKTLRPDVERWMEAGATGVIFKPFDPMSLADEVRRLVARVGPATPS